MYCCRCPSIVNNDDAHFPEAYSGLFVARSLYHCGEEEVETVCRQYHSGANPNSWRNRKQSRRTAVMRSIVGVESRCRQIDRVRERNSGSQLVNRHGQFRRPRSLIAALKGRTGTRMARKERVPPCAWRNSPLEKAGLRSAQKILIVSSRLDARAIPLRKIGASQRAKR